MTTDNQLAHNKQPRVTGAILALLATTALYACTPTGKRPELTDQVLTEATTDLGSIAVNDADSETLSSDDETEMSTYSYEDYYSNSDRNTIIQGNIDVLTGLAADLSRDSERFETNYFINKSGQDVINMYGSDKQGNNLLITVLGRRVPGSNIVFNSSEGAVSINPESFFTVVVPADFGNDGYYNYDADASFGMVDGNYRTTLRVGIDGPTGSNKQLNRYYSLDENSVNSVIFDQQDSKIVTRSESEDLETAKLIDRFTYERALQILVTIDNAGPENIFNFYDVAQKELDQKSQNGSPSTGEEVNDESQTGSGPKVITYGTVPSPTIINGTVVVNTVPNTTIKND